MRRLVVLGICSQFLFSCSLLKDGSVVDIAGDLASIKDKAAIPSAPDIDAGLAIGSGKDLLDAATISDAEVKNAASEFIQYSDKNNRVPKSKNSYAKRLQRLTKRHLNEDGLKLNFKVYVSPEVNAFATGDGSIRFYTGLMDIMNDDELLGVIGHEIGHVKLGHSHDKMRSSLLISAVRKGVASTNTIAGDLAAKKTGALAEHFLNAQYSQAKESASDEYGLNFMINNGYNPRGIVGAMQKLAKLEDKSGGDSHGLKLLSSHPAPGRRAERLAKLIQEKDEAGAGRVAQSAAAADEISLSKSDGAASAGSDSWDAANKPRGKTAGSLDAETAREMPRAVPAGFYLQVSAETSNSDARTKAMILEGSSIPVRLQNKVVRGKRYTRVLIGPYASYAMAKRQDEQAKSLGINHGEPFVREIK